MRLNMIDYVGVRKNLVGGWDIGYNRLSRKKLSCRSDGNEDIIKALCGWGVIRNTADYEVREELGQRTVFERGTGRPICALFKL